METVADGTVLLGTIATLSHALGVTVTDLRSSLRELLEASKIAVSTEARGQVTIRLERRGAGSLPALPPATERRRPTRDVWVV